jgi:hypothetical protein
LPHVGGAAYRRRVTKRVCALALPCLVLFAGGCDRTVSKDDCDAVGAHMRKVWDAEARAAAPSEGAVQEKAVSVIRSEGDRMSRDWTDQCKKELQGQRVDERELECLLAAPTIAAIQECGTTR